MEAAAATAESVTAAAATTEIAKIVAVNAGYTAKLASQPMN